MHRKIFLSDINIDVLFSKMSSNPSLLFLNGVKAFKNISGHDEHDHIK